MALTTIDTYGIKDGAVQIDDIGTLAGNLTINDSGKLRLGTGLDLQLYHDGSNSYITEASGSTPGDLLIQANNIKLRNWDGGQTYLHGTSSGSVDLYHDGNKKFETTATGVKVTGKLRLDDSQNIELGDSQDLMIYHSGSSSWIYDNGTGDLNIGSNGSTINMAVGSSANEIAAKFISDGAVELYYDNSKKLYTYGSGVVVTGLASSGNITLGDGLKTILGDGEDLQIYHDGSNSYLLNNTGDLILDNDQTNSNNVLVKAKAEFIAYVDGGADMGIRCQNANAASLYYDGSKKFETTSGGVLVTGNIDAQGSFHEFAGDVYFDNGTNSGRDILWDQSADSLIFYDNTKAVFGSGSDLQIYHDGTGCNIRSTSSKLEIRSADLLLQDSAAEKYFRGVSNGAVELYYDNSKTFQTTSYGAEVIGTFRCDALSLLDSEKIQLGSAGNDLEIYHDGNNNKITTNNGSISLESAGESMLDCHRNGSVDLFYDNSKKFQTTSGGAEILGHLLMNDSNEIQLGSSGDLKIYHSGSHSFITNNTGTLYFKSNTLSWNSYDGENMIWATKDAEVRLFYDNVKKFETTSTGVSITGNIVQSSGSYIDMGAGDLYSDDNGKIRLGTGDDFQIYHDGSHSRVKNTTGYINFESDRYYFNDPLGLENCLDIISDGAVNLYYDNSKKFETTSGGAKVTGNLIIAGDDVRDDNHKSKWGTGDDFELYFDGSNTQMNAVNGNLRISEGGRESIEIQADGDIFVNESLRAWTNDTYDLGYPNHRWDDVYATNGTINTSDRNEKNTIVNSDLGLSFVNKLKPVSYKFNGKTRTHYGLIAQDIETTLSDISKSTTDFAGFIKTTITEDDYTKKALDTPKTEYGLRYNEFIAPLIKAVQELSAEVETLKTKVAALEAG